jgi:hypothetical protein
MWIFGTFTAESMAAWRKGRAFVRWRGGTIQMSGTHKRKKRRHENTTSLS